MDYVILIVLAFGGGVASGYFWRARIAEAELTLAGKVKDVENKFRK